jgi:hypothetical protein
LVFFADIITHPAPNAKRRFTAADCTNIAAGRKKIFLPQIAGFSLQAAKMLL